MARRQSGGDDPPFQLGRYWLARERNGYISRCSYDERSKRVVRRSLKTRDYEQAKEALIVYTRLHPDREGDEVPGPRRVQLVAVFHHYLINRAPLVASRKQAEIALAHVSLFLFDEKKLPASIKADAFGLDLQAEFVDWSAKKFGHSAAYLSRMLTVVAAAMHFAAEEQSIDADGGKRTVRLMSSAPKVRKDAQWIARTANIAAPQKRMWVPSIEQMARFVDAIRSEAAFRFTVIALNTWARAETIMELDFKRQVDTANGLVDLNVAGRPQTIKRRPQIRLTRNLAAWIAEWNMAFPMTRDGRPIADIKLAMQWANARWMLTEAGWPPGEVARLAKRQNAAELWEKIHELEEAGAHRITRRVIRSFMATRVRGLKEIKVDREQRQIWLGHLSQDTTAHYEISDPDYLRECAEATDLIVEKIAALTKRSLWPPKAQGELPFLRVVNGGKK